jgi:hypothetical protein
MENWRVFVAYPILVHPINPDSAFQFVKAGMKDKSPDSVKCRAEVSGKDRA